MTLEEKAMLRVAIRCVNRGNSAMERYDFFNVKECIINARLKLIQLAKSVKMNGEYIENEDC